METPETAVNLKTEALKNGAIWGLINVVIFLITWYIVPSLMSSYAYSGLNFLIGIALAIFFCIDMRKKAGGYWTFGEALFKIFVMFVLSMAIMYIFSILFGKFIDTSYPTTMKEMILTKTESTFKSLGMEGEAMDKAIASTSESIDKQLTPTFSQAIVGFGISAVFYFIGAIIFSLIFKKSRPVFLAVNEE